MDGTLTFDCSQVFSLCVWPLKHCSNITNCSNKPSPDRDAISLYSTAELLHLANLTTCHDIGPQRVQEDDTVDAAVKGDIYETLIISELFWIPQLISNKRITRSPHVCNNCQFL